MEVARGNALETRLFSFTDKLAAHPERVRAILEDDVDRTLSTVFIDLAADACNHDCTFCDGSLYPIERARFTTPRLIGLADEIADLGADSIVFAGEKSEPLLHDGFGAFVDRLHARGLRCGIYTNGSVLRETLFARLERFAFVRLSLNAGTAETHRRIHRYRTRRNDFDRACRFLRRVAASPVPTTGVSFVVLPENVIEIARAAALVRRLGAHYLELKPAYVADYRFDANAFTELLPRLRTEIAAAEALEGERFSLVLNRQLRDVLDGHTAAAAMTELPTARPCLTSRLRLVVSPRGCFLCPPLRGRLDRSLGDATRTPLHEIWNGARHRRLLREPCALRCCYHAQNEALLAARRGEPLPPPAAPVQAGFL